MTDDLKIRVLKTKNKSNTAYCAVFVLLYSQEQSTAICTAVCHNPEGKWSAFNHVTGEFFTVKRIQDILPYLRYSMPSNTFAISTLEVEEIDA